MSANTKWPLTVLAGMLSGMLLSLYIGEWIRPVGVPDDPIACYVVEASDERR